jgi:NAD-dependent dihydropyrimidine dehydrogenase PreA subunit
VGSLPIQNKATNKIPEDAIGEKPARHPKGPKGKIVIFGTWCKGCGICVAFCPTGVLALDSNSHPVVVAPEKCTACHWCDTHCPDLAIVVHRIDE